jgi:DNA-binding MarR family transcriptional regulator
MKLRIFLACNGAQEGKVTVKNLLSSATFSDSGIRRHFEFLLGKGYVVLERDDADRRVRYVRMSKSLEGKLAAWADNEASILNESYGPL